MHRQDLERMTREQLIAQAERLGIPRPRVLTAPELIDELIGRTTKNDRERAKARGWLGRARDLLASVVERGLHLPEAARVLRKDGDERGWPTPPPPLPTVTLAEIYAAQGHLERALAVLDEVIAREPDHREAHAMRARFAEQHHRSRARTGKDREHEAPSAPPPAGHPQAPVDDGGSARRSAELRPQTPVDSAPQTTKAPSAPPAAPAAVLAATPPTEIEAQPVVPVSPPAPPAAHADEAPATTVSAALQTGPIEVTAPAEEPVAVEVAPDLELANTERAPRIAPAPEEAPAAAAEAAPPEEAPAETPAAAEAAAPSEAAAAAPAEAAEPAPQALPEEPPLPDRYEVDEIVAIAVDPRTLYFYWEVRPTTLAHARAARPDGWLCVRVASVIATWEGPLVDTRDLRVDGLHGDRFLRDVQPGSNLRVSVGWNGDGDFEPFAVGTEVTAPRAVPVETVAQEVARWEAEPVVAPFQNRHVDPAARRLPAGAQFGEGPMPRHASPFLSPSASIERAWSHTRGSGSPADSGVAWWEAAIEAIPSASGTSPRGEEYEDEPMIEDLPGWSAPGGSSELGHGPAQRLRRVRGRRLVGGAPGRPGVPAWPPGGASELSR